jgi:hypothetical protein
MMGSAEFTCELDVPFDSPQRWQDVVREWFPKIAELCEPDWIEKARSSDYVTPLELENPEDPMGPPGEIYGFYALRRGFPFSMDALKRRNLLRQYDVGLELSRLGPDGYRGAGLYLWAKRVGDERGIARLAGNLKLAAASDRRTRWLNAWRQMAGELPCVYGHVSEFSYGVVSRTRREAQQRLGPGWDPAAYCAARGIGWVTVVPSAEIGGAIGVDHLRTTGKFFEVQDLPGGLCWLQVSASVDEYDDEAYARASKAYEAVLGLDLE